MTPVPGRDPEEQAQRLAGALAELGAQELTLVHGQARTTLIARQADLPGVLRTAVPGSRLECAALGLIVEVTREGLIWCADDERAREKFQARLR